jgi:hypothetical protein
VERTDMKIHHVEKMDAAARLVEHDHVTGFAMGSFRDCLSDIAGPLLLAVDQPDEHHRRGDSRQIAKAADSPANGNDQTKAESQHRDADQPRYDQQPTHWRRSRIPPQSPARAKDANVFIEASAPQRNFGLAPEWNRQERPARNGPIPALEVFDGKDRDPLERSAGGPKA